MDINKADGFTQTEKILSKICDRTFLKIWNYTNPYNKNHKEFCDVIAVFENHIFIFFDRNKIFDFTSDDDFVIKWDRWYRDVIESQIKTCYGAERYIKTGDKLYLDSNLSKELPIMYDLDKLKVHKIIVAHGARDACLKFSKENINGSLGIHYSKLANDFKLPFFVNLESKNPIHVLDSHNLEIILSELDTFHDFVNYVTEKERAIENNIFISYCGEEDLLAYYLMNFDEKEKKHYIGRKDCVGLTIAEGTWNEFINSPAYRVKQECNKISYFWDELINEFCNNALKGKLSGDANIFKGNSGVYEMAKEPRFYRRALSENMIDAINNFPDNGLPIGRLLRAMDSFFKNVKYVFLQYKIDFKDKEYNEQEAIKMRQYFLEIACGATKLQFPELEKVIGIGMFPPKYYLRTTKDVLLMDCSYWDKEKEEYYKNENEFEINRFYLTGNKEYKEDHTMEFPESKLR